MCGRLYDRHRGYVCPECALPCPACGRKWAAGELCGVVAGLTARDFYKSMTTHNSSKVWQDVYRPSTQAGDVYLKLTVIDDLLIVSFKEL